MERREVRGILLEASVLWCESATECLQIDPIVERLLIRLSFSNLNIGVLFSPTKPHFLPQEEALLRRIIPWDGIICKQQWDSTNPGNSLNEVTSRWDVSARSCIFLTKHLNENFKYELSSQGWMIYLISDTDTCSIDNRLTFKQLDDFPSQIAKLNKQALGSNVINIGYTMKWSREREFLKRHAFPLSPTQSGLSFFALNLESSLEKHVEAVNAVLQKPTDEIVGTSSDSFEKFVDSIRFSQGMQQLTRYLQEHPNICVIDPLERIYPLLDRAATQTILQGVSKIVIPGHQRVRSGHFLKVISFDDPNLLDSLKAAKIRFPIIIKPQLACGIFDAHKMAVVFRKEGFHKLDVPLPCTIQEYVDHNSIQYKFYVIGDGLFHSVRRSTPNADQIANQMGDSMEQGAAITFHSLKSLPVHNNVYDCYRSKVSSSQNSCRELDMQIMEKVADWLRRKLNLTFFGFDVVIEVITGDHVIVDINYFPSFKDIPDEKALPAFWNVVKTTINCHLHHDGSYKVDLRS